MLIGNFCAIAGSAIAAIYGHFSDIVLKDSAKCPIHIYLALLSCFMTIIAYIGSFYMGRPVQIISIDPTDGLFGIFMTTYNVMLIL
jgi:hypothetical protein